MKKSTSGKPSFDFILRYRKSVSENFCGEMLKNIFGLFWTVYKQHLIPFLHKQKFFSHIENFITRWKMAVSQKIAYNIFDEFVQQVWKKSLKMSCEWLFRSFDQFVVFFNLLCTRWVGEIGKSCGFLIISNKFLMKNDFPEIRRKLLMPKMKDNNNRGTCRWNRHHSVLF